jgi:hypothetical protein
LSTNILAEGEITPSAIAIFAQFSARDLAAMDGIWTICKT